MALDLIFKVSGVTYEGRQEYLSQLSGSEACRIIPEPTNPYDSKALAVHIAMKHGYVAHVGYVPRELASQIAPLLDGEELMIEIEEVTGGFEMWDGSQANLGLRMHVYLEGETEEEDDDVPF